MEHDRFHVPYLSDKIPEDAFHGQAVKTVAYLRVSTAQQDFPIEPVNRTVMGVSVQKGSVPKHSGPFGKR